MQRIFGRVCPALAIAGLIIMTALSSPAQPRPPAAAAAPALQVAITYQGTLAGLITSSRFWMQGGGAQVANRIHGGWAAVADLSGMHRTNSNSAGFGLDMLTITFGPRYTWQLPRQPRYAVFGQGLVGVAHGFNSVFPHSNGAQASATSVAVKAGGGLNLALQHNLALRLFEADYLRTQLPNSTNNAQNSFQLGAGVVFRFR